MKKTIIDTGVIIAFFDESDKYCNAVRSFFKTYKGELYSTESIVTEVSYYFENHKKAQLYIIDWIGKGAVKIVNVENSDYPQIHSMMTKYQDTPMDYADASLMMIGEKLKITEILTIDNDFSIYKFKNGKQFKNLLQEVLRKKNQK